LTQTEILQVGGRAGRFLKEGKVTAFIKNHLMVIKKVIEDA